MNRKTSTLISLGISVALIAGGIWFLYNHHYYFGFGGRWNMPYHMTMGGSGMGIIMIIFWVVVLAAVILLVSGLITGRRDSNENGDGPSADDPLKILKQRYAKGEISKLEYDNMRQDLQ
jgi:putative membrane protein